MRRSADRGRCTMPMAATLTHEEARAFRKLLPPKLVLFLLTLPFRKGAKT